MKKFKIVSKSKKLPPVEILSVNRKKNVGGILITVSEYFNPKEIFNIKILRKKLPEYWWKPNADIFGGNSEDLEKVWYKVNEPVENYSLEILSQKIKILKKLDNPGDPLFLFLNNTIKK